MATEPQTFSGTSAYLRQLKLADFKEAQKHVAKHAYLTPLLTTRMLSSLTGFDVRLKAELFQKTGSYKLRGPLNQFRYLSAQQRAAGVICSSAGNHAQGVALAASISGIRAIAVMATNATPSKVAATRAYGAEVIQHGTIWDEANQKCIEIAKERGMKLVHPFDDPQLIVGQGTLGLEIYDQWTDVQIAIVPIGGGGLISGIAMALKARNPKVKIIGVESSGAPGMRQSIDSGHVVTLEEVNCVIDGLRVKTVGENTFQVVRSFVDDIVTLPDERIFEAVVWIMAHCKLVVEGAAAAPVAALLNGLIKAPPGTKIVCVLSGGNVSLAQLSGLKWN